MTSLDKENELLPKICVNQTNVHLPLSHQVDKTWKELSVAWIINLWTNEHSIMSFESINRGVYVFQTCMLFGRWLKNHKYRLKKHKRKPPTLLKYNKIYDKMPQCYKTSMGMYPFAINNQVSMSCIFLFTRSLAIYPHIQSTYILFSSNLLHICPKMWRDNLQFVLTVYETYNKRYILYYEENCILFCTPSKCIFKKNQILKNVE